MSAAPRIFIDADACPVKDEVYRVAARYGLHVFVVSNCWINTPRETWIEQVVVDAGPDIADDWIAERAGTGRHRHHRRHPAGRPLPEVRGPGAEVERPALHAGLRSARPWPGGWSASICGRWASPTSGPPPFGPKDRSAFLQALDRAVVVAETGAPR